MAENSPHASPRRAALYARISEDRHDDALGVERQLRDCETLAKARGLDVIGSYVDNDVSAWNGKSRPEFERLLADLEAGRVDVVVCWNPDRLYRRIRDLVHVIPIVEAAGASIASVVSGEMDLSTPGGRTNAYLAGVLANHEAEIKSARQKAKHRELAEAGRPSGGGARPFGYDEETRTEIVPEEAEALREVAHRILAGGSLRSAAAYLNGRGITTSTGLRWQTTSLKRLLCAPRVAGLRAHGSEHFPAVWPAIIERAEWERLRAILMDPARRMNRVGTGRSYLLPAVSPTAVDAARSSSRGRTPPGSAATRVRPTRGDADDCSTSPRRLRTTSAGRFSTRSRSARSAGSGRRKRRPSAIEPRPPTSYPRSRRGGPNSPTPSPTAASRSRASRSRTGSSTSAPRRSVQGSRGPTTPRSSPGSRPRPRRSRERGRTPRSTIVRQIVAATLDRVVIHPGVKGRNYFDPERVEIVWRV